jgi:hypothetical protein
MSVVSHLDAKKARYDPEAAFGSPEKLADEVGLTRGQKLSALGDWAFDVERRLAAGSEGMPTHGAAAADLVLLEKIRATEARLRDRAYGLPLDD